LDTKGSYIRGRSSGCAGLDVVSTWVLHGVFPRCDDEPDGYSRSKHGSTRERRERSLLAYHLPVLGLRSQRNSNPRSAKLVPRSLIVTRQVFSALTDTPMDSASWRMRISARYAHGPPGDLRPVTWIPRLRHSSGTPINLGQWHRGMVTCPLGSIDCQSRRCSHVQLADGAPSDDRLLGFRVACGGQGEARFRCGSGRAL